MLDDTDDMQDHDTTQKPSSSASSSSMHSHNKRKQETQPTMSEFLSSAAGGKPKIKLTQTDLDNYITEYLSNCVLPFHHVKSEGFQQLVMKLIHSQPANSSLRLKSPSVYSSHMTKSVTALKQKLVLEFTQARKVC